jgi:hypothetical protein
MTPERITDRDLEVLEFLELRCVLELEIDETAWKFVRPMDVGGSDGSHHHKTLKKLVRFGWAEERRTAPPAINSRPGIKYRITQAGLDRLNQKEKAA